MTWPQYVTDDMKALLAKAKKDREEHRRTCADLVERGVLTQEDADLVEQLCTNYVESLAKFVAGLPGGAS